MSGATRGPVILVTTAAVLVSALALQRLSDVVAPVFLALVFAIAVQPVRTAIVRRGGPGWAGMLASLAALYLVMIGFAWMCLVSATQFAGIVGSYAAKFDDFVADLQSRLEASGAASEPLQHLLSQLDIGGLLSTLGGLIGGVAGVLTSFFFLIVLSFFVVTDAAGFTRNLAATGPAGSRFAEACRLFAQGTRSYLLVSTVFGLVVALVDVAALYLLGIRDPWLWGLLAFLTNYIPNIGFLIGLVPPAIIALLDYGFGRCLAVIAVYCVVNFLLQTIVQPRVVGSSVGLSGTVSFLSLLVWSYIFGATGALIAIPLTLFVKAVFVDVDPERAWLSGLIGSPPAHPPEAAAAGPASPSAGDPRPAADPENDSHEH